MANVPELSASERKLYRGQAMKLKPAVLVGKGGASASVIAAVDTALSRDGLIKLRIEAPDKTARKEWLVQIATATGAAICGEVGHTASIYRPKPAATGGSASRGPRTAGGGPS